MAGPLTVGGADYVFVGDSGNYRIRALKLAYGASISASRAINIAGTGLAGTVGYSAVQVGADPRNIGSISASPTACPLRGYGRAVGDADIEPILSWNGRVLCRTGGRKPPTDFFSETSPS